MLDIIFRSILVEFIGASVKWLFYAVKNSIKGEKIVSFSEIWKGKKGSKDTTLFFHGLSNIVVSFIIIIILIGLGFLIDAIWY